MGPILLNRIVLALIVCLLVQDIFFHISNTSPNGIIEWTYPMRMIEAIKLPSNPSPALGSNRRKKSTSEARSGRAKPSSDSIGESKRKKDKKAEDMDELKHKSDRPASMNERKSGEKQLKGDRRTGKAPIQAVVQKTNEKPNSKEVYEIEEAGKVSTHARKEVRKKAATIATSTPVMPSTPPIEPRQAGDQGKEVPQQNSPLQTERLPIASESVQGHNNFAVEPMQAIDSTKDDFLDQLEKDLDQLPVRDFVNKLNRFISGGASISAKGPHLSKAIRVRYIIERFVQKCCERTIADFQQMLSKEAQLIGSNTAERDTVEQEVIREARILKCKLQMFAQCERNVSCIASSEEVNQLLGPINVTIKASLQELQEDMSRLCASHASASAYADSAEGVDAMDDPLRTRRRLVVLPQFLRRSQHGQRAEMLMNRSVDWLCNNKEYLLTQAAMFALHVIQSEYRRYQDMYECDRRLATVPEFPLL